MRKILLSITCLLSAAVSFAQSRQLEFTFDRKMDATVEVFSPYGLSATIEAVSPNPNAQTMTGVWNTGNSNAYGASMEESTNVLCTSTNTTAATSSAPIVYTLTVRGLAADAVCNSISFTNLPVNRVGSVQPGNDTNHCNFILKVNGSEAGTKTDENIRTSSADGKTITFDGFSLSPGDDGTFTIELALYKGTTNQGCFYGLTKITLDVFEKPFPLSGTKFTAAELMEKTEPVYIAIKGGDSNHQWYHNWVDNGETKAPTAISAFDETAVFVWEPVVEGVAGEYYLRKLNAGYMQDNGHVYNGNTGEIGAGNFIDGDAGKEHAAVFTAVPHTGYSGATLIPSGYAVRFCTVINGTNYWFVLGNPGNTSSQTPLFATSRNGGFTVYIVEEVLPEYSVKISSAGWSTFYTPIAVAIPDGVEAYYVSSVDNGKAKLTVIENDIPKGTAVLLEGNEGKYAFRISRNSPEAIDGNLLAGTVDDAYLEGDAYILAMPEIDGVQQPVGLYKAELGYDANGAVGTTHFKNNRYKVYLPASALPVEALGSAGFRFMGDAIEGSTVVGEVEAVPAESVIYDLLGRRVERIAERGIYIVNGNKVLVK